MDLFGTHEAFSVETKEVFSVWNADHSHEQGIPYLGCAYSWGYDQFYDDWRLKMGKFAAALKGVEWVE